KRGRVLTDVNRHIEDCSFHHAYQFRLLIRRQLVMQSANYAVGRTRLIILHEYIGKSLLLEDSFIKRFEEISSAVLEDRGIEYIQPLDPCLCKWHVRSSNNFCS